MQFPIFAALAALCLPTLQSPLFGQKTPPQAQAPKTTAQAPAKSKVVQFASTDGLVIRADLYKTNRLRDAPVIVLFHQAGWSRGEYLEIAPKLGKLGFNCLAVDLRSGNAINGVVNETAKRAKELDLATEYTDAIPDIISALQYTRERLTSGKVLAWGSSYSSALLLHLAGTQPKLMDCVLSFAPGEYFQKKGEHWVQEGAKGIVCPTFITSAKGEHAGWKPIFDAIPGKNKTDFVPETKGNHGSRALWKKFEDSPAYWGAVTAFLNEHFPPGKNRPKPDAPAQSPPSKTPPAKGSKENETAGKS